MVHYCPISDQLRWNCASLPCVWPCSHQLEKFKFGPDPSSSNDCTRRYRCAHRQRRYLCRWRSSCSHSVRGCKASESGHSPLSDHLPRCSHLRWCSCCLLYTSDAADDLTRVDL